MTRWDNDPQNNLKKYKQLSPDDPNKIGDVVIYYVDQNRNGVWDSGETTIHAALVSEIDKDGNTVNVTAKMGMGALSTNHPAARGYYDYYEPQSGVRIATTRAYFRK